jgi:hypothetical protein
MAEQSRSLIKREHKFDFLYFIAVLFAVLLIRDLLVGQDSFLAGQTPMWRPRTYGDGTAEAIDHVVKNLIDQAFQTARGILERNRAILDASARELLNRETLGPDDLARLTEGLARDGSEKRLSIAAG